MAWRALANGRGRSRAPGCETSAGGASPQQPARQSRAESFRGPSKHEPSPGLRDERRRRESATAREAKPSGELSRTLEARAEPRVARRAQEARVRNSPRGKAERSCTTQRSAGDQEPSPGLRDERRRRESATAREAKPSGAAQRSAVPATKSRAPGCETSAGGASPQQPARQSRAELHDPAQCRRPGAEPRVARRAQEARHPRFQAGREDGRRNLRLQRTQAGGFRPRFRAVRQSELSGRLPVG